MMCMTRYPGRIILLARHWRTRIFQTTKHIYVSAGLVLIAEIDEVVALAVFLRVFLIGHILWLVDR